MMMVMILIAMAATFMGARFIKQYAVSLGLIDLPNERSSHHHPTPRGGGLAFALVCSLGLVFMPWVVDQARPLNWVVLLGGLFMAGIGFWDDVKPLPAKWRFLLQLLAVSSLLWAMGGFPPVMIGHEFVGHGWLYQSMVAIALVWLINLYNFMDGIDGLATIEAMSIALAAVVLLRCFAPSALSMPIFLLLASCMLAFLPLNWSPAKVFMGDAGSHFLGYLLGYLIIVTMQEHSLTVWSWLILLGYFIVDATFTLLARLWRGQRVYQAHRSHAYQILSRRWGSHAKMSALVLGINGLWLFPLAILSQTYAYLGILWTAIAWLPLIGFCYWIKAGDPEA